MKNETKKGTDLRTVNKHLKMLYGTVRLTRGKGYYYLYSNDEEMSLKLAGLYQTSIHIYSLKHSTLEQVLADCKYLLQDEYRFGTDREPAI